MRNREVPDCPCWASARGRVSRPRHRTPSVIAHPSTIAVPSAQIQHPTQICEIRSPDSRRKLNTWGANANQAEQGLTSMERAPTQQIRLRDRGLMLWRTMGMGTELARTDSKPVQRTNLHNQISQCQYQQTEVKVTNCKERERQTSMGGESAGCIRTRTRTSRLGREVDPVGKGIRPMGKKTGRFIPIHQLLQSRTVGSLVR